MILFGINCGFGQTDDAGLCFVTKYGRRWVRTAESTKSGKFISETFPKDSIELAYEIPASAMTGNHSIQKATLYTGRGREGKSRNLALMKAFLGPSKVSGLSLHRLESSPFAAVRLYGKLANICPDLPSEHLAGTSVFKAIVDGNDTIAGEHKFKDSFDFTPFCRLMFSANHPPRSEDSSDGFFDKWLVVPFENRFRGESGEIPPTKLDAMLSAPAELSGLLNQALDALERLCRATIATPTCPVSSDCEGSK